MTAIRRAVLRLVSLVRSDRAEAELSREIDAHLRLLEDRFISQGMSVSAARNAARRAFGGVEQAKELQRDERSLRWLAGWFLDLKLGVRMLIKYPGLTLVGGFALAFGIAAGAATFEAATQLVAPRLPLDQGHRIVAVRNWDTAANREEPRAAHDVAAWRERLVTVEQLGAFRSVERNLFIDGRGAEPILVAEITASAFTLARVAPMLGRYLVEADERPGGPAALVIGHDVWQRRFGADPRVVGRTVRIGDAPATVVGVMPEGFGFPVAHSMWVPLRLDAASRQPLGGPAISIFGRLAAGATMGAAQAELSVLGARMAEEFPDTHVRLRPQVLPYARSSLDILLGATALNVFVVMFLVLVCANVAALVFARAMTRQAEILVRTALGASRRRIVMQLFAEALVLGAAAAVAGVAAAAFILRSWMGVAEASRRLPFWIDANLSPATLMYTAALTLVFAVIAGIAPALKVTGRRLESTLRRAASGSSDLGFGRAWTIVIVAQVAVTVAFPAAAFLLRGSVLDLQLLDVGFPAEQYLSARLEADPESLSRIAAMYQELEQRLAAEPGVAGVTFADYLPRTTHPERRIELQGSADGAASGPLLASRAAVAVNYFEALGTAPRVGRRFHSGDLDSTAPVVVVNESFAARVPGGGNPVGRYVRYLGRTNEEPSDWYEIVGVVKDLGTIHDDTRNLAGIYHPSAPDAAQLNVAVRVAHDPATFAPRFRTIVAEIDPTIRVHDLMPLDKVGVTMWDDTDFLWRVLTGVSVIALILSLTGIYSVMSFTVSRRTREIGVRIALGAGAPRIVAAIFSRVLTQVGLGALVGGLLVAALTQASTGLALTEIVVVIGYAVVMLGVCLLACVVPARRALRIEPTEALRAEA